MDTQTRHYQPAGLSLNDSESLLALGAGVALLLGGASRRSLAGACVALSSAPLLYRGVTGRWPALLDGRANGDTRAALGGGRGVHVREAIRLEVPVAEAYRFWRRFENLPRFMAHLVSVTQTTDRQSHWVAAGPAELTVEWDAEIINDVENEVIGWRSLPGADVVSAGSVNFRPGRNGVGCEVSVHLQYALPTGRAAAWAASLLGSEPSQLIREDLRRFKQLLETGEIARSDSDGPSSQEPPWPRR